MITGTPYERAQKLADLVRDHVRDNFEPGSVAQLDFLRTATLVWALDAITHTVDCASDPKGPE